MDVSAVFAYFSSISPVFKSWHGSGYSNRHARHGAGQVQMKGDMMMSKQETMKALEDALHIINAIRYDNELDPKHENKFWDLIAKLPESVRQSIIN
jgi:hypothetical protein